MFCTFFVITCSFFGCRYTFLITIGTVMIHRNIVTKAAQHLRFTYIAFPS
jgi:hypothetical protein